MSTTLIALLIFIGMLALMLMRVPVALAMIVAGVTGFSMIIDLASAIAMLKGVPLEVLTQHSFSAIPLFILMGVLAAQSGLAGQLFHSVQILCGGLRGGLAIATIGSCGVFASVSGSSIATASTMARVAIPAMRRQGYQDSLATGALAAGGTLGIMIPPSIALLIYAMMTEQSVGAMFLAGLLPGLLGLIMYGATAWLCVRLKPELAAVASQTTLSQKIFALAGMLPVGGLFVVIIGGIYRGFFTPTEGAAVGAFFTMLYAFKQGMRTQTLIEALNEALRLSTMVFLMLIGAQTLSYFIAVSQIAYTITDSIMALDLPLMLVIAAILLFYFLLGMFIDAIAMLVITVPVVFPIITSLGVDPIWFGILTVLTVELGLITPPVGMNVFVIKAMTPDIALKTIYRGVWPFIVSDIVRLLLLLSFPMISLLLL